jgi:hypothetical protein
MPRSNRIWLLALTLALLAVSSHGLADSWILPGLANSEGRNGTRFESTVFVLNAGSSEAEVRFGFVPPDGPPPAAVSRRVMGAETLLLPNALRDLFGLEETLGTLTIESSAPIVVGGATRNVASVAGTYGVGLEPVSSGNEITAGKAGFSIWLSHTGLGETGSRANITVALLESGTSATLEIHDSTGELLGTVSLSADSPRTWQASVADITDGKSVDPGFALLKLVAGRAAGFVSVVDNTTGDGLLSPFQIAPNSLETDLIVNGATLTPGANGTRWTTGLRLLNPGNAAVLVSIDTLGVTPAPVSWRIERNLPASGLVALDDVLKEFGAVDGSAGALRIRSASPVLVLGVTTTPDPAGGPGRFGVTQSAVIHRGGFAGAGRSITLAGLGHTGSPGQRTNLAFLSGTEGAKASASLRLASGSVVTTVPIGLGSSEWKQKSLPEWFGIQDVAEGARVDVTVTSGSLDAYAPVVDNGTGDAVVRRSVFLPAACDGAVAGPTGDPATTFTVGAVSGAIVPLLGVNIGPIPAGQSTADLTGAYHDAGVTCIRTHDYYGPLDMATIYPNQNADPANPSSYNFTASDSVFEKILAGSFEPFLRLGDSYSAQPPYPPANPRRPTNPDNWVRAAVEVVRHYDDASRWRGRPLKYVEIWNEPDNGRFWDGTPEEFYSLFVKAAKALKQAFPHLRIGGPGFSPFGSLAPKGQAISRGLIERMKQESVELDYFSFHVYSNDPEEYRTCTRFFRGELDRNGYAATPLVINEWNTETRTAEQSDALALRTGGRGAAIASAVQVVMQEEGIVESCMYRGPDPAATAPEFYGIFYSDGRPKRSALALSLWKRLADHPERLTLTSNPASGLQIYAIAGRDPAGEIAMLVANPSSTASTVRISVPDNPVSCLRVDEISDASETISTKTVAGDRVTVGGYSTLFVTLRP